MSFWFLQNTFLRILINCRHIETSQVISSANQLTFLFLKNTLMFDEFLRLKDKELVTEIEDMFSLLQT